MASRKRSILCSGVVVGIGRGGAAQVPIVKKPIGFFALNQGNLHAIARPGHHCLTKGFALDIPDLVGRRGLLRVQASLRSAWLPMRVLKGLQNPR
jgi:hypothetical protein